MGAAAAACAVQWVDAVRRTPTQFLRIGHMVLIAAKPESVSFGCTQEKVTDCSAKGGRFEMQTLIPTDSVFLEGFHRIEKLFHEPTPYVEVLSPEEVWTAGVAYEAWWRIAEQLPPAPAKRSCHARQPDHDGGDTFAVHGRHTGSSALAGLHVVEIDPVDLAAMELFHGLRTESEREGSSPLAEILRAIEERGGRLGGILAALRMQPPPGVLAALRTATPQCPTPTTHVCLNSDQEQLRAFLGKFEQTLYH